ncbi:MAG: very short patch repair endonuclease [Terricaulis sp.]|nr:very short patch repair endonuclease [Terricaulis sp.]
MADTRSPEQRRRIMQSVGTRDTGPEKLVRSLLHRAGYLFRLHRRDLPGRPDIVLPTKRAVIFVHGCYWHGHGCAKGQLPKSRLDYWGEKIETNRERDARNRRDLKRLGWASAVVWQCELKRPEGVLQRLQKFLEKRSPR